MNKFTGDKMKYIGIIIIILLSISTSKLISQNIIMNLDKLQFIIDSKIKVNKLQKKSSFAVNNEQRNFASILFNTKNSSIRNFSKVSSIPKFNFNSSDLKGKANILPAKSDISKFTRKKSWTFPRNEVKTKAWKI
jgi:hypothetical protein